MNYDELKEICRVNKISLQTIASETGVTMNGLKRGIEQQSLAIRYVIPLCKSLCMTPNRMFGIPEDARTVTQTQNGGRNNTQIYDSNGEKIKSLEDEIVRLKEALEDEKDRNKVAEMRINKFIDILNNK